MKLSSRAGLILLGVGAAGIISLSTAMPALAATATATLTGASSPTLQASTAPTWTQVLDGLDHNGLTASGTIDVVDGTGSAAGWSVSLGGAALTNGSYSLPQPSTASPATFSACDANSTCTLPTSNTGTGAVSYPFTVGTSAAKFYSATAGTGMGRATGTSSWAINIPGNAYAGSYTSTWTYSLNSAP